MGGLTTGARSTSAFWLRQPRLQTCGLGDASDASSLSHLEPRDVKSVIGRWREFLNEDPGSRPPLYRVYHLSFA